MTELIHYSAVASVVWSVFCRARRMDSDTPARLKVQHGMALILSLLSLPIFGLNAGPYLMGLALCLYLVIDAPQWRKGVPGQTLHEVPMVDLQRIYGRGDR